MDRRKILMVTILVYILSACSSNQPSENSLLTALSDDLPGYAKVTVIDIKAIENIGSEIEPKYKIRFVANVKLDETTYDKIGHISGNVNSDILIERFPKGTDFKVYGKAISVLYREKWVTRIEEFDSSVENLGKLFGKFTRAVIDGSSEYESAMKKYSEFERVEAAALEKTMREKAEKIAHLAKAFSGKWKGTYICGQGVTGLTLDISTTSSSMSAIFNFYPLKENLKAKSGSFSLVGNFSTDGTFILKPNTWIDRPAGYIMVGMSGEINTLRTELKGSIDSGCSSFLLNKINEQQAK